MSGAKGHRESKGDNLSKEITERLMPDQDDIWLRLGSPHPLVKDMKVLLGTEGADSHDDNVDFHILLADHSRWYCTLITPKNIQTLMERWALSGEAGGGLYCWISDMIIIRKLTVEIIKAVVVSSLDDQSFYSMFEKSEDNDDSDEPL